MISIFLAKVLGVYLVVVCIAVLLKRQTLKESLTLVNKDPLSIYFSGAMLLLLGLVMVNLHNIWTFDYRGVITILGWLTVLKGVMRFYLGEKTIDIGKSVFNSKWYMPLIVAFLLIGLWLTGIGYGVL